MYLLFYQEAVNIFYVLLTESLEKFNDGKTFDKKTAEVLFTVQHQRKVQKAPDLEQRLRARPSRAHWTKRENNYLLFKFKMQFSARTDQMSEMK